MPQLPSRSMCLQRESTLAFITFSLILQLPHSRPSNVLSPLATLAPHPHAPSFFLSSAQMSLSQSGLHQSVYLIINCCSPAPFSQWPYWFIFFVALTNVCNWHTCLLPVIPQCNISSRRMRTLSHHYINAGAW